jgi:acetylornithine deacetylase/succinyl-diaminopimelate desuccinylase-like protein
VNAVDLLCDLVAMDSTNPTLVAGGAGEAQIAAFVGAWLERAGLEVSVEEPAPGRPNVVGRARGRGGGRSLLLNAHMDTVGTSGMEAPHTPRIDGDRLYGRGAYDMKAGLAAAMLTAAEARRLGLGGDVFVAAVVDEEAESIGTEALVRNVVADAAIVTEPTGLDICIAHRGFVWAEIETVGRAAHGSRPDLGVDAIAKMGPVLVELERLAATLAAGTRHPLLGTGSVHASTIEGGRELSTYPEQCVLGIERRTIPGESAQRVETELKQLVDGGDVRVTFSREPLETSPREAVVETLARCVRSTGFEPELVGAPFWTDAGLLAGAGIPSVLFGPGGEGAHAALEWVDLRDYDRCIETLIATAAEFCSA